MKKGTRDRDKKTPRPADTGRKEGWQCPGAAENGKKDQPDSRQEPVSRT